MTSRPSSSFPRRLLLPACAAALASAPAAQDPPLDDRVRVLEEENRELSRKIDILTGEYERLQLGESLAPEPGERFSGLGAAASKIYRKEDGLSIGGYGEAIYTNSEDGTDTFDFTRNILYFGYKFDESWVFNSEIEIEHADEIFLEFAYVDYLHSPTFNVRAGMLLLPMGFLNELHEPTTFYGALRPVTETVIIPSTWRENGAGIHGDAGPISYRAYVVTGLDGKDFTAEGLRGGRQKGSQALAEDMAFVARADWTDTPGLLVGASLYVGDSGQGETADPDGDGPAGPTPVGDLGTTIVDVHAEWQWEALRLRGLYAAAELDDTAQFNAATGRTIGSELDGWYLEAGYDVMSHLDAESEAAVIPFVRYEEVDTQADLGATANDREFLTVGVNWQPIPQVVFKADVRTIDDALGAATQDVHLSVGYVF